MRAYTGVGSRKTPNDILRTMTAIATRLSGGYVLRSGAAIGADSGFEMGCGANKQIFKARRARVESRSGQTRPTEKERNQ